jgi:hypothetical protein
MQSCGTARGGYEIFFVFFIWRYEPVLFLVKGAIMKSVDEEQGDLSPDAETLPLDSRRHDSSRSNNISGKRETDDVQIKDETMREKKLDKVQITKDETRFKLIQITKGEKPECKSM